MDFFLEVWDDEGEIVEVISDSDFHSLIGSDISPNAYSIMKELFETARRKAMGVESALEKILSELEADENTPF